MHLTIKSKVLFLCAIAGRFQGDPGHLNLIWHLTGLVINPEHRQPPPLSSGHFNVRTDVQVVVNSCAMNERARHAIFACKMLVVDNGVCQAVVGANSHSLLIIVG